MAEMDIDNATTSDFVNEITLYDGESDFLDSPTGLTETEYTFTNFGKQLHYFNSVPELRNAILMKAVWNVGKGWTANSEHKAILDLIQGNGADTFDDILFNMNVTMLIAGDAFAEIIRTDSGTIQNIKPLNTGSMRIVVDGKGMIKRYEQLDNNDKVITKFNPKDIFHLCNNRIGDQIHGLSEIDAVEDIIKADYESFADTRRQMKYQARPLILWKLKTDDTTAISNFVGKIEKAKDLGEDMFIPDDDNIVSHEIVNVDLSSVVLAWANEIKNKFYRSLGLPLAIFGGSGTESQSKVEYLAHEQVFERGQRYIERQVENQLGLKIDLISPVTLLENLKQDESKDAQNALALQQSDVTAFSGRDNE